MPSIAIFTTPARSHRIPDNHLTFDSFGNLTRPNDSTLVTRYLFVGREYDDAVDMYYYRARFYDSNVGRFISEDPVFGAADYAYVENQPTIRVDPFGLESETIGKSVEGVIDGKKRLIRVDIEIKSNKVQVQSGGGKKSVLDVRIDPDINIDEVDDHIRQNRTITNAIGKKGKAIDTVIGNVKKALRKLRSLRAIRCFIGPFGRILDVFDYDELHERWKRNQEVLERARKEGTPVKIYTDPFDGTQIIEPATWEDFII